MQIQAQSEYAQKETNVFFTIEYELFNIETREKLRNRIFYTREVNILFQANELQL